MRYRKFLFIVFAFVLSMLTFNVNAKTEKYNIISGDLDTVGSEVCFGDECFYVISNDGNVVSLFAKYNLYVGYSIDESGNYTELEPTYLQDSRALGFRVIDGSRKPLYPFIGTVKFSDVSNKSESASLFSESIALSNALISSCDSIPSIYSSSLIIDVTLTA